MEKLLNHKAVKNKICFFVRCKPSGECKGKPENADIIELVTKYGRVFIGYPPWKKCVPFNKDRIKDCIFDLNDYEPGRDDKNLEKEAYEFRKQIHLQQGIVKEVGAESIVVIPRPETDEYYIGLVERFELIDDPKIKEDYLKLRKKQGLDKKEKEEGYERRKLGDVVQTFLLKEPPHPVSLTKMPGDIRISLFSRPTMGRIKAPRAYETLKKLYYDNKSEIRFNPTDDENEIIERMKYFLTPNVFEHMMCELLQLEEPDLYWWHIGGTGDGGVDAIAFDKNQKTMRIVQCKLKETTIKELRTHGQDMLEKIKDPEKPKAYVCNFYLKENGGAYKEDEIRIFCQRDIIQLLKKHKKESISAKMMGLTK
jgi:hypothetical protein